MLTPENIFPNILAPIFVWTFSKFIQKNLTKSFHTITCHLSASDHPIFLRFQQQSTTKLFYVHFALQKAPKPPSITLHQP